MSWDDIGRTLEGLFSGFKNTRPRCGCYWTLDSQVVLPSIGRQMVSSGAVYPCAEWKRGSTVSWTKGVARRQAKVAIAPASWVIEFLNVPFRGNSGPNLGSIMHFGGRFGATADKCIRFLKVYCYVGRQSYVWGADQLFSCVFQY